MSKDGGRGKGVCCGGIKARGREFQTTERHSLPVRLICDALINYVSQLMYTARMPWWNPTFQTISGPQQISCVE